MPAAGMRTKPDKWTAVTKDGSIRRISSMCGGDIERAWVLPGRDRRGGSGGLLPNALCR